LCGDLATSKLTGAELSTYYKITGEDLVHGRVIRHMPINFRPRSKLAWAFNKLPMMSMNVFLANEFWRRCIIIETKYYEYTNDHAFEDKLGLEIPGIYNHFFEEGVRLLVEEGFKEFKEDNYKELKNKWISHMRTASDEEIIKDPAKISFVLNAEDVKEPLTDVTGLGIGKKKE
jgi:phage/plasmid-associated DNA primase